MLKGCFKPDKIPQIRKVTHMEVNFGVINAWALSIASKNFGSTLCVFCYYIIYVNSVIIIIFEDKKYLKYNISKILILEWIYNFFYWKY